MKRKFGYSVKAEDVIGRVVCWNCRNWDVQLFRCPDLQQARELAAKNGDIKIKIKVIKSKDYICLGCRQLGHTSPPMDNVSIQLFKKITIA